MIKLQDFAKQQGVTDRAIQKHLKTYADELEGLYERKGPNGTWLSDEACEILRSKMKHQPIIVSETSDEIERLRVKNEQLLEALNVAKDKIIDLQEQNGQLALERAKIDLLEAENSQIEKEKEILEGFIKDAKAEIDMQKAEKAEISAERNKERERADRAEKTAQKANAEAWHHYRVALEIYNHLPWWKKRRRNKPMPPEEEVLKKVE